MVVRDPSSAKTKGVGARNERHLCVVNYNVRGGVEVVQGLLDNIMVALKVPFAPEGGSEGYYLKEKDREYGVNSVSAWMMK